MVTEWQLRKTLVNYVYKDHITLSIFMSVSVSINLNVPSDQEVSSQLVGQIL